MGLFNEGFDGLGQGMVGLARVNRYETTRVLIVGV